MISALIELIVNIIVTVLIVCGFLLCIGLNPFGLVLLIIGNAISSAHEEAKEEAEARAEEMAAARAAAPPITFSTLFPYSRKTYITIFSIGGFIGLALAIVENI